MRILIVDGSQKPPTFVGNLIDVLLQNGFEVALYGQESSDPYRPGDHKFSRIITQYKRFNAFKLFLRLLRAGIASPALVVKSWRLTASIRDSKVRIKTFFRYALIVTFRPHIIHLQWPLHLTEFEALINSGDYKTVVSLRGKQIMVDPQIKPNVAQYFRKWFPLVSGFHAVSKAAGAKAEALGASAVRVNVIHSGVPDFFFRSFDINDRFLQKPLNILSVGRANWQKGYTDALDAMKILAGKGISFHYTLIAPGPVSEEILHHIHTEGLSGSVSIINEVPYHRITEEMKKFSVLLLPSVSEGIANVVLEAMAAGLPVISTDCGGMGEVVKPAETGILVKRRDANAIAAGLLEFQELSTDEVNKLRRNAFEFVRAKFSQLQQVADFVNLYQSLS